MMDDDTAPQEDVDNTTTMTEEGSTIMTTGSPPRTDSKHNHNKIGTTSKRQRNQTIPSLLHANTDAAARHEKKNIPQLYLRHAAATTAAATSSDSSSKQLISKLKILYKYKVLPIEKKNHLYHFCLPTSGPILDAELDARPMVLLLGPYSTGKTTFIRYLLGGDFPGVHIGPEPTTDKFMALVHGNDDEEGDDEDDEDKDYFRSTTNCVKELEGKIVKGNTLTVTPELPFSSLATFGSAFLNHFHGSICPSPLLRTMTLIDTPGILSGEKQRVSRDYDFAAAAKWFADRSDLILLLVDAHKLDFSDELKEVIATIRPHNDDKIRCILNKADGVSKDQLVRVYGSLMWSLGRLFHSPEVVRVFTGSFWERPLEHQDFQTMFEADEWFLMNELMNLPSVSAERKVNAMVQRIRIIKVHVCILGYLRSQMPRWYGKKKARGLLLEALDGVFTHVQHHYSLPVGDFPNVDRFRECLENFDDFTVFPNIDHNALRQLDDLIGKDIPAIMKGSGGVSDSKSTLTRSRRRIFTGAKSTVKDHDFSPTVHEGTTPMKSMDDAPSHSNALASMGGGNFFFRMFRGLFIATVTATIVSFGLMHILLASRSQSRAMAEL